MTRKDPGVKDYKWKSDLIDAALKKAKDDGGKEYWKVMMDLDILTLAVYTADANFGGYISTSTSTVIAKHFANSSIPNIENPEKKRFTEEEIMAILQDHKAGRSAADLARRHQISPATIDVWKTMYGSPEDRVKAWKPVYCYSVRCKNGFYLPTDVKGEWKKWQKKSHAQNAFAHHAEQEVAVAGGIGWADVVGVRRIRVDLNGQFFCGPVFLSDMLRQEYQDTLPKEVIKDGQPLKTVDGKPMKHWLAQPDDNAFDQLFELFSGKSQGTEPTIYFSYDKKIPFDCPRKLVQERNQKEKDELSAPRFREGMKDRKLD